MEHIFKKPQNRNFDNVQFADLRKIVDKKFNDAHDELSDAYYNHWKKGDYSVDFQGHSPAEGATLEQAKELFDKLHGLIFDIREVEFHKENLKQPAGKRIDEAKYNEEKDEQGNITKKHEKTQKKIDDLKKSGIELTI